MNQSRKRRFRCSDRDRRINAVGLGHRASRGMPGCRRAGGPAESSPAGFPAESSQCVWVGAGIVGAWYELQQVAWAYARRIGNVGRGIRLANTVLI